MAMMQRSVKERMVQIIDSQPDDSSFDEILRELAMARMIDLGLEDVAQGNLISHDQAVREMKLWGK